MQVRKLQKAARTLSIIWAGWLTLFGVASGIGEKLGLLGVFMHTIPGLVFLVTTLAAWKWNFVGGVLLVVEALLALWRFGHLSAQLFTLMGLTTALILGLPPIVAGLMFIIIGRRSGPDVKCKL